MSSNEIAETEGSMNKVMAEYANVMAEDIEVPIVDIPTTVEEAKDSGYIFQETTELEDDLKNEVKIPGGFHIAEDSGTKVEEGVVIEDDKGNQFVWIPVGIYQTTSGEKINNLSRRSWASENVIAEPTEVSGDEAIQGINSLYYYYGEGNSNSVAKNQIEEFKDSSTKNKGFYFGRYEAGTEIERVSTSDELTVPLVQANKNVYVYVTRDQAKTLSEAMYTDNQFVTSELMSSYAWDTALNFICQNSKEEYLLATTTNSIYGNIGTNIKELTGKYLADNYCNIHDVLGNCYEFTTEYCNREFPVPRGGNYNISNIYAARRNTDTNLSLSVHSFRLQLYVN